MRLKVKLCDAVAIKNLVLAASSLPCDVDLQSGSFVVDAKSILGVLGLPKQDTGILQVHSDDPNICTLFLEELEHLGILCPEGPMIQKTTFLACALGEMLIDFTMQGRNEQGQRVFAQNAGGAPPMSWLLWQSWGQERHLSAKPEMICTADSSRRRWNSAELTVPGLR